MVSVVIRLKGTISTKPKIKRTLELLNLQRTHHAAVLPENPVTEGMLRVVKDYVTWGEVDAKLLADIIRKRGELTGHKPVTDEYIKNHSKYKSVDEFASAISKGEAKYTDLPDIKPIIRLPPPKKGYRSLKRSFNDGGDLGYRGKEIATLIERML